MGRERQRRWEQANIERVRVYRRAAGRRWRARNPGKRYGPESRRTKAGTTLEYRAAALARQDGCCAICDTQVVAGGCMDHDHRTGHVRDVLCAGCNTGLGWFRDDPARCRAAAAYLDRHQQFQELL